MLARALSYIVDDPEDEKVMQSRRHNRILIEREEYLAQLDPETSLVSWAPEDSFFETCCTLRDQLESLLQTLVHIYIYIYIYIYVCVCT
jgi:hypothetical protein